MHAQMYWPSATVTPLQQQSEHLRPLRPPPWNMERHGDQHVGSIVQLRGHLHQRPNF
jgi:hypothetical protein